VIYGLGKKCCNSYQTNGSQCTTGILSDKAVACKVAVGSTIKNCILPQGEERQRKWNLRARAINQGLRKVDAAGVPQKFNEDQ
jgi:hypothetical protein